MAKKNSFLSRIWNWITGNNSSGQALLNALMTPGPLSYSVNEKTGETSGGLSSIINRVTQDNLTGAENAQNAFNAEEAQKNRDWQESMSNTAYQRATADMQAAGLNPALMYGNGSSGASTPSGSTASGQLGSAPIGLSDLMALASFKKKLKEMDADIELKGSQAFLNRANANLSGSQNQLTLKQVKAFDPMNKAQLDNLVQDLSNKRVQEQLDRAHISESEARREVELNNAFLSAMDIKYRDQLNDLNVRLRISELGLNQARQNEIGAQINELYQRAILEAAQAGHLDQATTNLAIEAGILKYDEQAKEFSVSKQRADRNWRIAGQVVSSVVGVAGAAGATMMGIGKLSGLPAVPAGLPGYAGASW